MISSARSSLRFSARRRGSAISFGVTELAHCGRLDPVSQGLLDQSPQFLRHRQKSLSVLHPLGRQLLEFQCARLFRHLHSSPFQCDVILRHPWKTKFREESHFAQRQAPSAAFALNGAKRIQKDPGERASGLPRYPTGPLAKALPRLTFVSLPIRGAADQRPGR